jgi:carbohydrate esterase-like sialic acid-specific acetylesterase
MNLAGIATTVSPSHYLGIIHTGQSIATGDYGDPPLSTTADTSTVRLFDSSESYNIALPNASTLSTVPLISPMRSDLYMGGGADTAQYPNNIGGESPEIACAMTLRHKIGTLLAPSNVAQGGAAYSVICKGGTGNAYAAGIYEAHVLARLLPGYQVLAILLSHGEADALNASYQTNLYSLISNYQTDLGLPSLTMIISQQNNFPTVGGGEPLSTIEQLAAVVANPGVIVGACPKYQYLPYSDDAHLLNTQYRLLGEKYAQSIYIFLTTGQWSWMPFYPTVFSRSGNTITIGFNVPVGNIVIGSQSAPHGTGTKYGAGGSVFPSNNGWTGGYGLELWSDTYNGTPLAISSVHLSSNGLTITGVSTPHAVSYALTADRASGYTGGYPDGRVGLLFDQDTWAGPLSGTVQPNPCWAFAQSGL